MLPSFTVTMCVFLAIAGEKLIRLSGRPRDLWRCIFHHRFGFQGANYWNIFYDCNRLGSLGQGFDHGSEFPLSFLIVVG